MRKQCKTDRNGVTEERLSLECEKECDTIAITNVERALKTDKLR